MPVQKQPKFLDFDFEIESNLHGIFSRFETAIDEQSQLETALREPEVSTTQSMTNWRKRRSSVTTACTENMPATPATTVPDSPVRDIDIVTYNQRLSREVTWEIPSPKDQTPEKQPAEPQQITEYEAFRANAQGAHARQARRNPPAVDEESDITKASKPKREPGRRLIQARVVGRIVQSCLRYFSLWTEITVARW